jgi:anti-anti-sigma regulatory factor
VIEIRQNGQADGATVLIRCDESGGATGVVRGLDLALRLGRADLVVDLGAREGADADLLGVLHRSARPVREAGGRLVVVCLDPRLRRLLDVTLLSRSFRVCATREEALAG